MRNRYGIIALLGAVCWANAQAQDLSTAAEQAAAIQAESAQRQATKVRQKALRNCYKELQAKSLAGTVRHEFMQNCIAEKKKAAG